MKLQSLATLVTLVPYALCFRRIESFPEYRALVGLSPREVRAVARAFRDTPGAHPLPPPIKDTSAKLVNDPKHPYMPDRPGDIRGPCPALNTLSAHGYLPRNGVATPAQIITAVQEGFNMGYDLASFVTYAAFVVDGNHLTNLMSIGTTADDERTPGLNISEGDASTTRGDRYFGNNNSFNETLFDQFKYAANLVGDGFVTIKSAALQKSLRINDSISRNPTFSFDTPRFRAAYAETAFPLAFFVSNQTADTTLNLTLNYARSFYEKHTYPKEFYRRQAPYGVAEADAMFTEVFPLIRVLPGYNKGVDNYVVNLEDDGTPCYGYHKLVNLTAHLYPKPPSELKKAIKANLVTFYQTLQNSSCEQYFPYGQ